MKTNPNKPPFLEQETKDLELLHNRMREKIEASGFANHRLSVDLQTGKLCSMSESEFQKNSARILDKAGNGFISVNSIHNVVGAAPQNSLSAAVAPSHAPVVASNQFLKNRLPNSELISPHKAPVPQNTETRLFTKKSTLCIKGYRENVPLPEENDMRVIIIKSLFHKGKPRAKGIPFYAIHDKLGRNTKDLDKKMKDSINSGALRANQYVEHITKGNVKEFITRDKNILFINPCYL